MKCIPPEARCLIRQGRELWGQKRYEAAVKCLRKVVLIAPRFAEADRELQDCLTLLGKRENASGALRVFIPGLIR